jgi:uncharacterized membrane protein YfcA
MKTDKASITRLVMTVIALLAYFGVNVPDEYIEYLVGAVMLLVVGYTFFRNNYLTRKGLAQKETLKRHDLD